VAAVVTAGYPRPLRQCLFQLGDTEAARAPTEQALRLCEVAGDHDGVLAYLGRSRRACTAGLDPESEHAYNSVAFGGAETVRATVPGEAFSPRCGRPDTCASRRT
jgi:hypothetical protein